MKKSILIIVVIALFSVGNVFSQDAIIQINNTSISTISIHDFGEISDAAYTKYIIKNNRRTAVTVSEVKTPSGFFANISDMNIAAGKNVILYVGLDPKLVNKTGAFDEKIVIKTNLVIDIEIPLKGVIVE